MGQQPNPYDPSFDPSNPSSGRIDPLRQLDPGLQRFVVAYAGQRDRLPAARREELARSAEQALRKALPEVVAGSGPLAALDQLAELQRVALAEPAPPSEAVETVGGVTYLVQRQKLRGLDAKVARRWPRGWSRITAGCGGLISILFLLGMLGSLGSHNPGSYAPIRLPTVDTHPTPVPSTAAEPNPQVIAHYTNYTGNVVTATGTMKNEGKASTPDVHIAMIVYDGTRVIGTGQQDIGSLASAEQKSYTLVIHLTSAPDSISTQTRWQWAADQCPAGTTPSPDPSDPGAQWCNNPTQSSASPSPS